MPAPTTVPIANVPEVQAYMEAKERLDAWVQQNEANLRPLRDLLDTVRTAQQAADKQVRALNVFCGPWVKHRSSIEVNTQELLDTIGVEAFLGLGGEKHTKVEYTIDKQKLDMAIANGTIPPDLAEKVRIEKIAYSAPKAPSL